MQHISTAEARENFADLVNKVDYANKSFIISRHGKDIAAIVPLEVAVLFEQVQDELDIKSALKAKQEMKRLGGISWDELKNEV